MSAAILHTARADTSCFQATKWEVLVEVQHATECKMVKGKGLIDTGSEINVVTKTFVDNIGSHGFGPTMFNIDGVGGPTSPLGTVRLSFRREGSGKPLIEKEFVVVKALPAEAILVGSSFIEEYEICAPSYHLFRVMVVRVI